MWCTYFISHIEISAYFPCCRSKLQNTWRSSVGLFSNTLQFSVDSMFCFLLYYHHLWKTVPSIIVSNMRYIILSLLWYHSKWVVNFEIPVCMTNVSLVGNLVKLFLKSQYTHPVNWEFGCFCFWVISIFLLHDLNVLNISLMDDELY